MPYLRKVKNLDGKEHGPYWQRSKRVGDKIVTEHLGRANEFNSNLKLMKEKSNKLVKVAKASASLADKYQTQPNDVFVFGSASREEAIEGSDIEIYVFGPAWKRMRNSISKKIKGRYKIKTDTFGEYSTKGYWLSPIDNIINLYLEGDLVYGDSQRAQNRIDYLRKRNRDEAVKEFPRYTGEEALRYYTAAHLIDMAESPGVQKELELGLVAAYHHQISFLARAAFVLENGIEKARKKENRAYYAIAEKLKNSQLKRLLQNLVEELVFMRTRGKSAKFTEVEVATLDPQIRLFVRILRRNFPIEERQRGTSP